MWRKGVSYEGPSLATTIIRSQATFDEFMDEFCHMTGYEKKGTHLAVIYRYPVTKET